MTEEKQYGVINTVKAGFILLLIALSLFGVYFSGIHLNVSEAFSLGALCVAGTHFFTDLMQPLPE